jgi:hypothetical protein
MHEQVVETVYQSVISEDKCGRVTPDLKHYVPPPKNMQSRHSRIMSTVGEKSKPLDNPNSGIYLSSAKEKEVSNNFPSR